MNKTEFHKCSYCGDERKAGDMKQVEITFRDRDPWTGKAFINKKRNWYCNDKPCAGYDQMAHEG